MSGSSVFMKTERGWVECPSGVNTREPIYVPTWLEENGLNGHSILNHWVAIHKKWRDYGYHAEGKDTAYQRFRDDMALKNPPGTPPVRKTGRVLPPWHQNYDPPAKPRRFGYRGEGK